MGSISRRVAPPRSRLAIIVMTGYGNVSRRCARSAGSRGLPGEARVPRVLLSRIREALAADQQRQERSAVEAAARALTSREKEVAGFLVKGKKRSKEIAAALGISPALRRDIAPGAAQMEVWLYRRARHPPGFTQQPTTPATPRVVHVESRA